jgi:hypothetical protein
VTDFAIWLMAQHFRRDDVGDLARFAAKNPAYPRRYTKLSLLLRWAGEDPWLRHTLKHAHREWRIANPRKVAR